MPANDEREDYLRSDLVQDPDGFVVTPFEKQDSSMLGLLARAKALCIRPPFAKPAKRGDRCRIIRLR
jgi:molybdopterin molybdotransferase